MFKLLQRVRTRGILPILRRKEVLTLQTPMKYSITYDIVTEESAKEGDYAESGYEIDPDVEDLESIIRTAESYGIHPGISGSDSWYSEGQMDMHSGDTTSYAAHISWPDGSPLTRREVQQIDAWWDEV